MLRGDLMKVGGSVIVSRYTDGAMMVGFFSGVRGGCGVGVSRWCVWWC